METDTQYHSIKPVLYELLKNKISFDIYIPELEGNPKKINEMYDMTSILVKKDGFRSVIRKVTPKKHYHLALIAPHYEEGISAKYYVKYSYGSSHSLKPSLTHRADMLNHYHGYLVYNLRDAEIFSAFSKTYLLPDLKHVGYKHVPESKKGKQTIIFLPSWEDQNNLGWILEVCKKLKKEFRIIVKLHPFGDFGTEAAKSVGKVKHRIRETVDEYYDGEAPLSELLGRSDLVVSDISGAIFDALYVSVPVIIYSKNIHKFDVLGIKSAAAKYAGEGYIAVSDTVDGLIKEIPNALSRKYLRKQLNLADDIFCRDFTPKATYQWMCVIKAYLNDEVNQEYFAMQNLLTKEFWYYKTESDRLRGEIEQLDNEIKSKKDEVVILSNELSSFLGIKRSALLLGGNIKRKAKSFLLRGY